VRFYKTDTGNEPVREWLRERVTEEEKKIIGRDIKIVQFNWPIGMPLVEAFGDGLWQVRSTLPNRIGRVFLHSTTMKLFYCMDLSRRRNKLPSRT
jgi:hypothetical protein